jgi:UDP-N-acetylmuramyl-tripeptide synthetase
MKTLAELIEVLLHKETEGPLDRWISGITYHTGRVRPGSVFVCLPGTRAHGATFARAAVEAGAVAVVTDGSENIAGATTVRVPDTRLALALLAAEYYDYPSRELVLVGVTGTNGKTTTTHLIDALFKATGAVTGLIGTVRYRIGEEEFASLATTPEASDLQQLLRGMRDAGVTHVAMEVSSHALALQRTVGCDFDTVVLTNITEDHLDFHGTFENYLSAKTRLFTSLGSMPRKGKRLRRAVLNGDDPKWRQIMEQTPVEPLLYGLSGHCHVRAGEVRVTRDGVSFQLRTPAGTLPVGLRMTGLFSVYNALAASGVGLLHGLTPAEIRTALEAVPGVPGRFELVSAGQDFTVIVDYAHTPDGLENVLRAVREFATARVITVFGCGGERDRGKRPLMGEVAGNWSDYCAVTSDNPRGEDPLRIIAEILPGIARSKLGNNYEVLPDRKEAITRAIGLAGSGDVVLIAGKGHETSQIFDGFSVPFDDRAVAREVIRRRLDSYGTNP